MKRPLRTTWYTCYLFDIGLRMTSAKNISLSSVSLHATTLWAPLCMPLVFSHMDSVWLLLPRLRLLYLTLPLYLTLTASVSHCLSLTNSVLRSLAAAWALAVLECILSLGCFLACRTCMAPRRRQMEDILPWLHAASA